MQRCIDLVIRFATETVAKPDEAEESSSSAGDNAAFTIDLMEKLLKFHNSNNKAVRLRVCQLAGGLLNGLGEEAEIGDKLWQSLESSLLFRLRDKVKRFHAQMRATMLGRVSISIDEVLLFSRLGSVSLIPCTIFIILPLLNGRFLRCEVRRSQPCGAYKIPMIPGTWTTRRQWSVHTCVCFNSTQARCVPYQ